MHSDDDGQGLSFNSASIQRGLRCCAANRRSQISKLNLRRSPPLLFGRLFGLKGVDQDLGGRTGRGRVLAGDHDGDAAPKMTTLPALLWSMPNRGSPGCDSLASSAVERSKSRAVVALSMARSMLPMSAPSWRTNASRWPAASTTAML